MEHFRGFLFFQLLQNLIFLLEKLKLIPYQGGILNTYQDLLMSHLGIKLIFIAFKEAYGPLVYKCFLTDTIQTQTLHCNRNNIQQQYVQVPKYV